MRTRLRLAAATAAATLLTLGTMAPVAAQDPDLASNGRFLAPFAEPTVGGVRTEQTCVEAPNGTADCKPTAGSVAILPQDAGQVVYFNALEGTENVRGSIVAEFGSVSINAQARFMDLGDGQPVWKPTDAVDSGVNRDGNGNNYLVPGNILNSTETYNDGSLFCADLNFLPDGRVVTVGGTSYYQEPGNDAVPIGVVELEGTRNTRVYDPATNTWSEFEAMEYGRWYPTLTTLADGRQFVVSGVEKLLKPVYPDHPADSGRNVIQTELFDPAAGTWRYTGVSGDKSLPLFPRMHLLPNGHVLYNTAGQVFNPFGQSYDEALWNISSAFNPSTRGWTDLGVPGLQELQDMEEAPERAQEILPPDLAATFMEQVERGQSTGEAMAAALETMDFGPAVQGMLGFAAADGLEGFGSILGAGFRGSTFSVMLPLEANDDGRYGTAEFLTAGGIVGLTPGTYFPVPFSRIDTVETSGTEGGDGLTNSMDLSTRWTGSLDTGRWYSSGVLLPSGEVLALNGSTADEVVNPGTGYPVLTAELFDPETETWRTVATQNRARVYHNSAALLPDGRVLVGGHDMISTAYGFNYTIPGGSTPTGRDPSFEIFEPPYLHYGVDRPVIRNADDLAGDVAPGQRLTLAVDIPPSQVDSVVLVRNPSYTHLVDADQRNVVLPITRRNGSTVSVELPEQDAVLPPGPYMLFVNRASDQGPVPSVSVQLNVPGPDPVAGEPRTNDVVGERPRSSDPVFVNELPPPGQTLPHGEDVPPTGNTDPEREVGGEDDAADDGDAGPGLPDLPAAPPAGGTAGAVGAADVEGVDAPLGTLDAATIGARAAAQLPAERARASLIALAMTGVLVGAVAHLRLARRRWAT